MGIPDHLTCLLRNLYAGQEAAVRTGHETIDWFQIGKGVHKAVYCHPVYLTYMQSASCKMLGWMKHGLNEAQAGIKIAGKNINNFRYADDTTLMAESEEELKSLLDESEKAGLKLNIQKTKIMASSPITPWKIDGETMERVTDSNERLFLGLQNHCR